MGYVGNEPTSNFASVTKDSFSGDGSTTAFTLSKASTTNGVAVFVENVRQEPTTAYAVSGTTLTFTAAPVSASGNNIYVLHHNAPASTANHPSSQSLTAVNGTMTGTLAVTGTSTLTGAVSTGGALTVANGLTLTDGDITVASGHGVSFAATSDATGMTSELLDDYEEGVFQTTVTCGTSGTVTLNGTYDDLRYTKVGRLCTVNGDLRVSSVSSPDGELRIGLPFTSHDTNAAIAVNLGIIITHSITKQSGQLGNMVVISGDNQSYVTLQYETSSTRLGVNAANCGLATNDELVINLTYTTA